MSDKAPKEAQSLVDLKPPNIIKIQLPERYLGSSIQDLGIIRDKLSRKVGKVIKDVEVIWPSPEKYFKMI